METTLAAAYCEGWDNGLVNPLTQDQAESRDSAGEPYSVVLLAGGRLHTVLNISWTEGYCAVLRYDADGHRVAAHELRRAPEGDLFLRESATWAAPADDAAARHRTAWQINGRRSDDIEPAGRRGGRSTFTDDGFTPPRLPLPAFGRWNALLDRASRVHAEACVRPFSDVCVLPRDPGDRHRVTGAPAPGLPSRTSAERPWFPPRPLQPRALHTLFRDGAERTLGPRRMRISTHAAGKLNLPSGRLIAADPSSLDYGEEPFVMTVSPGTYPVTISLATFTDDENHSRVAAARLDISDRRPVRWELALREGQDLLDLGYGEFFGFGVDAGMACFVDDVNHERLAGEWESLELRNPRFASVGAGDMIAWSSGWGDGAYPTWIGRDHENRITTFVADMLLFPGDD
ncbi:hypothetical protein Aab01nite_36600 [Paractinoplanes abujensis]|uniref:DUF4241 domain-containing protein n=1 Tax=Paractinoplanes abujensis TaxID=882441 RepID=A0A7W7G200_9ACTN|nr:DUF4241 domain-containing protein [Actinoplanes abujensis]MBB4694718.1 hypothetical protein [Actinoplanes abujensis]GID20070.1 hypothetical protein Aab01nite_36600 [Actinoplanes abujensis]